MKDKLKSRWLWNPVPELNEEESEFLRTHQNLPIDKHSRIDKSIFVSEDPRKKRIKK